MKKLILAALLALGLITPLNAATTAFITLTGTVPLVLTLSVTSTGNGTGLDLSTAQTNLKLADVLAVTNRPSGLTVTIKSGNVTNGDCTSPCFYSSSTSDSVDYTLDRDGTGLTFSGDTATYVTTASRGASNTDLQLSYSAATTQAEATDYSDDLTLTVTAN